MPTIDHQTQAKMGNPQWSQNWTLDGRNLYCEIMQPETKSVWLCQQAITPEEYEALQLPEGFIKSGIGKAAHDAAYFRRSPDATVDGPLDTLEVDGRVFSLVAKPGEMEPGFKDVLVLPVHKHHTVLFAAGRTIEIMDFGDGWDYVPQVIEAANLPGIDFDKKRVLPEGWSVREVTLAQDLIVEVPYPARVCFFSSGHSFQGPVRLSSNEQSLQTPPIPTGIL